MNYEWIKETNWKNNLEGNLKVMEEIIGIDALISLFKIFSKSYVYFSEKELFKLKKNFVLEHQNLKAVQIAKIINTSERFVYKTLQEFKDSESPIEFEINHESREYLNLDLS